MLGIALLGSLHLAAIIYQNFAGRNSSFYTGAIDWGAPLPQPASPFVDDSKAKYKKASGVKPLAFAHDSYQLNVRTARGHMTAPCQTANHLGFRG